MTTEDDFQAMLDANPGDSHTRLILADWLQDRDDPRASGYRALGTGLYVPHFDKINSPWGHTTDFGGSWCWWSGDRLGGILPESVLPRMWFQEVISSYVYRRSAYGRDVGSKDFFTRREAEDAAAIAWLLVPRGVLS